MTNAEKYLKDGVDIHKLGCEMALYTADRLKNNGTANMEDFFKKEVKPTLTEDERVILRNTKGYTTIIRNIEGNIQIENENGSFACLCAFNHLFQFIKEGEKYSIEELLKGE